MDSKMQDKWNVQKKFSKTEKQLDRAIKKMEQRHPLEDWIITRISAAEDPITYLKLEAVQWLEEVYYNSSGFYLDLEINFFEKQIARLETELNLIHQKEKYSEASANELMIRFNKNKNAILKGVQNMTGKLGGDEKHYQGKEVIVSAIGVEWLDKNYFRKNYLKNLELYKLELQRIKKEQKL